LNEKIRAEGNNEILIREGETCQEILEGRIKKEPDRIKCITSKNLLHDSKEEMRDMNFRLQRAFQVLLHKKDDHQENAAENG
jgi:hypothetical protein